MRSAIVICLLCLLCYNASAQLKEDDRAAVAAFVNNVKQQNIPAIAGSVSYPLRRQYPLPAINDSADFVRRFKEVFDDSLTKLIITSDVDSDWSAVGWRGIMLERGDVWLDYDGSLMSVNYQSATERRRRDDLIRKEKAGLHKSISQYKTPLYILTTGKYRIRIDELDDGSTRYASWPVKAKAADKPDLVIHNGEYIWEGSGGNHTYRFVNDGYTYDCSIIVMGAEDEAPAMLTITKDGKELLSQKARLEGW